MAIEKVQLKQLKKLYYQTTGIKIGKFSNNMTCFPWDLLGFAAFPDHLSKASMSLCNDSPTLAPHELQYIHDFQKEYPWLRDASDQSIVVNMTPASEDGDGNFDDLRFDVFDAFARYMAWSCQATATLKMQSIPTFPSACKSIERSILRQTGFGVSSFEMSKMEKTLWGPAPKVELKLDLVSSRHRLDIVFVMDTETELKTGAGKCVNADYLSREMLPLPGIALHKVAPFAESLCCPNDESALNVCNSLGFLFSTNSLLFDCHSPLGSLW